jgi:hypothetical protein
MFPKAKYGDAEAPLGMSDDQDDDQELSETPADVVAMLGFDPLEFSEEALKTDQPRDDRGRWTAQATNPVHRAVEQAHLDAALSHHRAAEQATAQGDYSRAGQLALTAEAHEALAAKYRVKKLDADQIRLALKFDDAQPRDAHGRFASGAVLYHGTSTEHIDSILANGLVPSADLGFVYAADNEHDAMVASRHAVGRSGGTGVILAINTAHPEMGGHEFTRNYLGALKTTKAIPAAAMRLHKTQTGTGIDATWKSEGAIDCTPRLVCKQEGERQIVMGEVYAPDRPDSQGEYMTKEEILKMAHEFVRAKKMDQIDILHNNKVVKGCSVVESFVAPDGSKDFLPGSWVVAVHIPDLALWMAIKSGEINGFSMQALVTRHEHDVEIEIPPVVTGMTSKSEDHQHVFYVTYDDEGLFKGGVTNQVNGHQHRILAGTHTEDTEGHSHRFSSVDDLHIGEAQKV